MRAPAKKEEILAVPVTVTVDLMVHVVIDKRPDEGISTHEYGQILAAAEEAAIERLLDRDLTQRAQRSADARAPEKSHLVKYVSRRDSHDASTYVELK